MGDPGNNISKSIAAIYRNALDAAGVKKRKIERIAATGYGSDLVKKADAVMPEAICIARAIHTINPDIRIAVDVGGLFIDIIVISENGLIKESYVNDKCAAGSGKFLEMVSELVSVPIESIGGQVSDNPYIINSQCAVFAESEIISQVNAGMDRNDIVSGVLKSIASRTASLLDKAGDSGAITLCGGVSRIGPFRAMLEGLIGRDILTCGIDPQIVPAYGAALIAGMKRYVGRKMAVRTAPAKLSIASINT
jgi:(R)-2-hydroxyacyl-CoA dehydratese activating ATPase